MWWLILAVLLIMGGGERGDCARSCLASAGQAEAVAHWPVCVQGCSGRR
jgi:hypothetical protein